MQANASRIAPLDALRGVAALVVVVYHYVHLAPKGLRPLEFVLGPIYQVGYLAVPVFYTLSGYIFFTAYASALGERRVSGREYFWLRASRLYPLHLLTLLVVTGLQTLTWRATGKFFIYTHNDLTHFLLNLGFLHAGWYDNVLSFNGPAWSLSIEAGVYVVFFAFARVFGAAAWPRLAIGACLLALFAGAGDALPRYGPFNTHFVHGLACFFVGGAMQLTDGWTDRRRLVLGVGLVLFAALLSVLTTALWASPAALCLMFAGLISAALGSPELGRLGASRPCVWLGEISYSIYLWHFPVQLVLVLVAARLYPLDFSSPIVLALYLAATLAVSTLSYRGFEIPARKAVRRWASARRLAPAVAAA